jgi:transposase
MSLNIKHANFKGQDFFVGIDTHKTNWKVTIRTKECEIKTFSMNPDPEELSKHMRQNYPDGTYHSVYEAGFCGYWIHRALVSKNIRNRIVNPADVPSTNKERDQKSDPIDSRKLSRELANNSLTGIYVPSVHIEALRCVHRSYRRRSKQVTRTKNSIKGLLHFIGIKIPIAYDNNCWSNNFVKFLETVECPDPIHRINLNDLLNEFITARKNKLESLQQIRTISKDIPTVKLLQSVPGIGLLTAFALYVEIGDMQRFKSFDQLASYVGLVPSVKSSDTTVTVSGITFRHNKYLRSALVECAWVSRKHDPALLHVYSNLVCRMNASDAIVRIAKKLLNRIRCVWLNQKEYEKGIVAIEKV